ncbi:thiol-disulfide oxidoreductase DCC family protein [Heyndrickxia sp. NPDC080065]|uniref:thiol-disulfide oxidoreductase DCC family protein n=1 Tax=Heyndrickxia sp. NPDC080065 TaxID=3390568 RepID=UPI003D009B71
MAGIILFDGVCNFCNSSVQFIIKRDPAGCFKFASLQSEIGKKLLREHGIHDEIDSFVLIEDNTYYIKSSAALRMCKNLQGLWRLLYLFLIIPPPIRDFFYDLIAKNRYKWFGIRESCMLPTKEERDRFLE